MFFAGPGKGGLAFLFGAAATVGIFSGLHIAAAAALKTAGATWYTTLIGTPSDWLSGVFKSAVNGVCGVMGWSAPTAFAGAGDAFIPPGAADSLSNGTSWLKSKLGFGFGGSGPFIPPAELMPG
jgi:hypothetical protein